jgi:hypothetical protein
VSRVRASATALVAASAALLATEGWHALRAVAGLLWRDAGWFLLGLAALNLLRAVVPSGALVGPVVLAAAAAGILVSQHQFFAPVSGPALAASALALIACAIVAFSPAPVDKAIAIGWVVRRKLQGSVPPTMTVVAVLGLVGLDLRTAAAPIAGTRLNCLILGGRIELKVPATAEVELGAESNASLVRTSDEGVAPAHGGVPLVHIRLRGAVGGFALYRA